MAKLTIPGRRSALLLRPSSPERRPAGKGDAAGCQVKVTLDGPGKTRKGQPMDPRSTARRFGWPRRRRGAAARAPRHGRLPGDSPPMCSFYTGSGADGPPRSAPRNVVISGYRMTRAPTKYRLWNKSSRVETPVLDAFSQNATRFAVAYAQGNESRGQPRLLVHRPFRPSTTSSTTRRSPATPSSSRPRR